MLDRLKCARSFRGIHPLEGRGELCGRPQPKACRGTAAFARQVLSIFPIDIGKKTPAHSMGRDKGLGCGPKSSRRFSMGLPMGLSMKTSPKEQVIGVPEPESHHLQIAGSRVLEREDGNATRHLDVCQTVVMTSRGCRLYATRDGI